MDEHLKYSKVRRVIEEIAEENRWRDGEFAKFKLNASQVDEDLWAPTALHFNPIAILG